MERSGEWRGAENGEERRGGERRGEERRYTIARDCSCTASNTRELACYELDIEVMFCICEHYVHIAS